jgi:hypothetical protein
MSMTPIELLLSRLQGVKKTKDGWIARCPAHDDRKPSLSIAQGENGFPVIWCHARCESSAVIAAIGLTWAELRESKDGQAPRRNGKSRAEKAKPKEPAFAAAEDAIAALERQYGKLSAKWTYYDATGKPVGYVIRWDTPYGKEIRPVSLYPDGWRIAAMPEPRPLYRLPDLANAKRVAVCEGEKAADAARRLGFIATTSASGANAAEKTDWSPLAGKEVWIFNDNDSAGRKYADIVSQITGKLFPAPTIRILDLVQHAPNLPDGGDLADILDDLEWCGLPLGDSATQADLAAMIEQLAKAVEPWRPPKSENLTFRPFPVDSLPDPIRGFVKAWAKAIGCDYSYLGLVMLTTLAAAIGNTRRLELKRGWSAPPIIWVAIVGESGTAKTPAFKLVMRPIRERQRKALERYQQELKDYKIEHARREKSLKEWERKKNSTEDPPPELELPQAERFVVSDTTIEALAPILLANSRGVLMARDELAGWIGSFDRYNGGKGKAGADAANWLSMFNAESIIVDRKTGFPRTIYVPHAAVCVVGGIQPVILIRALSIEHRESGLAARLLLTWPPRKAKRWTEADIDPKEEAEFARIVERLFDLQPIVGRDNQVLPGLVRLEPDAKEAWIAYYNAHAEEQVDLTGDLSAAWSKLEEYAARLALVIHFVRWAATDPTLKDADYMDLAGMKAGIILAEWFKHEARRVYSMLDEGDEARDQRRLVEWIGRKGGSVTPRDVQQGCRWLKEPSAAEAALDALVKAGRGTWESTPAGQRGRPTRRFRLSTASTVYGNGKFPVENTNTVDVDSVDAPKTDAPESPTGDENPDPDTDEKPDGESDEKPKDWFGDNGPKDPYSEGY